MISTLHTRYRYSLILLRQLVVTDFKLRYQGSALGYIWSLLRPLFMFAILYMVFVKFLKVGGNIPHFPVYLLLGIVLWNFFAEVTNTGVKAIVDRGDLIRKINFPKYVIILAAAMSALINLLLNFVVIAIFMKFGGVDFGWHDLWILPYMGELFALALAVAFLLSAIFVRIRDINYIWEVFMQAFFYATPILYPLSQVSDKWPKLAKLMLMNPAAQIIQDVRFHLITPATMTPRNFVGGLWVFVPFIILAVLVIGAVWFFKKRAPHFAEEV